VLLKALPNLVKFDGTNTIDIGIQKLKELSEADVPPTQIERLCYHAQIHSRDGNWEERLKEDISFLHGWIHGTENEDIINKAVKVLYDLEEKENTGSYEHLKHFISTVSEMFPKTTNILFFMPTRYEISLNDIWSPLKKLVHLTDIFVYGSNFDDITPLLKEVPNLSQINLRFNEGKDEEYRVACVDHVLSHCSKIEKIEWHDRAKQRSTLSSSPVAKEDLSAIKSLSAFVRISKEAFLWMWANLRNISSLYVSYITLASAREDYFILLENLDHQEIFFKDDILRMFRSNPMKAIRSFSAQICLHDILTAKYLVEMFRKHNGNSVNIGTLYIKVELMRAELTSEKIEQKSQEIKTFTEYCKQLEEAQIPTKVTFNFVRMGGIENYIDWHGNVLEGSLRNL